MKSLSNLSSLLVLLFISSISNAQLNQNQQTNAPALTNGVGLGEQFYTAPPYQKKLLGNPYLDEDWKKGKLKVKGSNQVFTLDQLKYDVANDLFELFIDNKVVNISGSNVVSFELSDNENVLNRRFIRAADYTIDGKQVDGYFEVLHEGEVLLFERSYAYIKKATYNQALMIGEKDDTILIKAEYYYTSGPSEVVHIKKTKDLKPLTQEGSKPKISIDRGELISFFRASVN